MPQHNQLTTEMTLQGGMERLYAQMQAQEVLQDSVFWQTLDIGVLNAVHIYWGPLQFHPVVTPKASIQLTIFANGIVGLRRFISPTVNVPNVAFAMPNMNNMGNALNPLYIYPNAVIALAGFAQEGGKLIPAGTIFKTDWFKPTGSTDYMWRIWNANAQNAASISVEVTVRLN